MRYLKYSLKLVSIITILAVSQIYAQFIQQGNKLVGTGGIGPQNQGLSVSISADGNTVIAGGLNDNNGIGAAWIFARSNQIWSQQGGKLLGSGAVPGSLGKVEQGMSVSISADGTTAIVGSPADSTLHGASWVYTRTNGVWTQQGPKLVGTGAVDAISGVAGGMQGTSVSISGDGNTALVGAAYDSGNYGAAWVFTRSKGVWTQQGNKLVGSGAAGNAEQGFAVALSTDGGSTWTSMSNGISGSEALDVNTMATSGTTIFAGTGTGVWESTNGGANWYDSTGNLGSIYILSMIPKGSSLIVGVRNGGGVFFSSGFGPPYTNVGDAAGLSSTWVSSLGINSTELYAGISGAGVWRRPLSSPLPIQLASFSAAALS